ncbi:MAG: diguanylate cyclase [Candidatus Korobacteraceae bacterium]
MATDEAAREGRKVEETFVERVLIADDDPVSRYVLEHDLAAQGYIVQCVTDGREALAAANHSDAPRLIVLDWMMPGMSGPEICANLRQRKPHHHYQYVLLLSSRGRINDVVAGLDAGADDYLVKPFNSSELLARLRAGSRILRLHDDLLEAQELLRFQATHDPLTGIWNRGALMQLAQAEIQRAQRSSVAIGFLMIDVDHFKIVNDNYGHAIGDLVLRQVARRLSQSVRGYDVVGRYGGEEFAVVAAGLDIGQLSEYAERMRQFVAFSPITVPQNAIPVTISIGIAVGNNAADCELDRLVERADASLYEAKGKGRNQIAVSLLLPSGTPV